MIFCTVPDINVWLALSHTAHEHHLVAWKWYQQHRGQPLAFCRVTQLGFLRLSTTPGVAGTVVTQSEAWIAYKTWFESGEVLYLDEPSDLERRFRNLTQQDATAHKEWTDSYLIAFASAYGAQLVTFDKGMSRRYEQSILINP